MSSGIRIAPRDVWFLFDISNGGLGVRNYVWWFESRAKARAHKKEQHADSSHARLAGPFHYRIISEDSTELEFHEYDCRYWRIGKSHGPCTCKKIRRERHGRQ